MRNAISLITVLLLTGCQALDSAISDRGVITYTNSEFDNSKSVYMSPAMTDHGLSTLVEFGLYWGEPLNDSAYLSAQVGQAINFDPDKALQLRVDQEKLLLPPVKKSTGKSKIEYDTVKSYHNLTVKEFVITKDQIRKLLDANEAAYRISLLGGEVLDGSINYNYKDYQSYVIGSFNQFYEAVWSE